MKAKKEIKPITIEKLEKWLAAAEYRLKCCITVWETNTTKFAIERYKLQIENLKK